jgi:hypothetical protein
MKRLIEASTTRRGHEWKVSPSTIEIDSLLQADAPPIPISIEELADVVFEVELLISIPPISIPE